jgi:hypothetical protein
LGDNTFGFFGALAQEEDFQAHRNGRIPVTLGKAADGLLAKKPDI